VPKSTASSNSGAHSGDDPTLLRYFNDCLIAVDILYEEAAAGHRGAKEVLRDTADRLVRKATIWRKA